VVKRVFLDEDSVELAQVPVTGEAWISDTKVKGFGLRLFNTKSGPVKRFCIRTVVKNGKSIRKTYNDWIARHEHNQDWQSEFWFEEKRDQFDWSQTLGRYAQAARTWAKNEILLLKGIPTLATENNEQAKSVKEKLSDVTLTRCVEAVLSNYRKMKLTTAYIDRVEKIFVTTVPRNLQTKLMREISKEDAERIIKSANALPGNRRTLIPFLGRVFNSYAKLTGEHDEFWRATYHRRHKPFETAKRFQIDDAKLEKVRCLISILECEENNWQQALCLRLYLSSDCPLSRLMAARWDELYEVTDVWANKKRLQWRYDSKILGYVIYQRADKHLIQKIYGKVQIEFPRSAFWFPSKLGRKVGHIRTVDQTWIKALNLAGLNYVTPKKMKAAIVEFGFYQVWPNRLDEMWEGFDF
jgi:hypothetical protein